MMGFDYGSMEPVDALDRCIADRSKQDQMMGLLPVILLAFTPLVVFGVLTLMCQIPRFSILSIFPSHRLIAIIFEYLVLAEMVFRFTNLRYSHSKRDRVWRGSLIRYVEDLGLDASELRSLDERSDRESPRFATVPLLCVILLCIWIDAFYLILPLFPDSHIVLGPFTITLNTGLSVTGILPGAALCFISFISTISVFDGPFNHEKMQADFTERLTRILATEGIRIEPMVRVVSSKSLIHRWLTLITFGLYYPIGAIFLIRALNMHLMNQQSYETRLLEAIRTGRDDCFDGYASEMKPLDIMTQIMNIRKKTIEFIMFENKMPPYLRVAEVFLVVMAATYIFKMTGMYLDFLTNPGEYSLSKFLFMRYSSEEAFWFFMKCVLIIMYTVMFALTVKAAITVESKRAIAWRRVVRTCITFTIPTWFSELILSSTSYVHMFDLEPLLTSAVLLNILLMMTVSISVKRYYTPAGYEIPGIRRWLRFLIVGKLIRFGKDDDVLKSDN